jgi:hypothetical protein
MDKIQELIPYTILDLQKFVVADADNSVSAVVEGNGEVSLLTRIILMAEQKIL